MTTPVGRRRAARRTPGWRRAGACRPSTSWSAPTSTTTTRSGSSCRRPTRWSPGTTAIGRAPRCKPATGSCSPIRGGPPTAGTTSCRTAAKTSIDGLLREIDETGYDRDLDGGWVRFLDRWYSPLRFPVHGLQMLAAYIGQMAPASRITNCAAFQAADELRRLQRIAYRTVQLSGPPLGDRGSAATPGGLGGRRGVPAAARADRTGAGRLRLGRGVHGHEPRHQAPARPAGERGDRGHAGHSERRPDTDQHPLLARRGRALALARGRRRCCGTSSTTPPRTPRWSPAGSRSGARSLPGPWKPSPGSSPRRPCRSMRARRPPGITNDVSRETDSMLTTLSRPPNREVPERARSHTTPCRAR